MHVRRRHPFAVAIAVALASTLGPCTASAEPTTFDVDVVLEEKGCPSREALTEAVHRLTGIDASTDRDAARFRVAFTRSADGFEAQVRAPNGTRRVLEARRCEQLLSAVAAVVALTLDPLPNDLSTAPEAAPEPPPPPPPSRPIAPPPESRPIALAAHGWGTYGVAPTAAAGVDVYLELSPTTWSTVGAGLAALAPGTTTVGVGHVSHAFVGTQLAGCAYPLRGPLSLGPCVDAVGGMRFVDAGGVNVTNARATALGMGAFGLSARMLARVSRPFSFDLVVGALLPLPQETFQIVDPATGQKASEATAIVALSARLGLRYEFR